MPAPVDFTGKTVGGAGVVRATLAGWLLECACGAPFESRHVRVLQARSHGTRLQCDACKAKARGRSMHRMATAIRGARRTA